MTWCSFSPSKLPTIRCCLASTALAAGQHRLHSAKWRTGAYVASQIGPERTVGGTVLWSATFAGPGTSELTQDLSTLDWYFDVGEMDGRITPRIQNVKAVLDHMGPTQVCTGLMATRWAKLINNACMSGMSAVCGCTFGQVLEAPKGPCLSELSGPGGQAVL